MVIRIWYKSLFCSEFQRFIYQIEMIIVFSIVFSMDCVCRTAMKYDFRFSSSEGIDLFLKYPNDIPKHFVVDSFVYKWYGAPYLQNYF